MPSIAEPGNTSSRPASILLVTRNMPPLRGGMERLNHQMAIELAQCLDVKVVGPAGCGAWLPDIVAVQEVEVRPVWRFLLRAFLTTVRLARRSKPDVVLAGSGLTAPMALLAARLSGGRSAVYVHGLDLVARHPVYRAVWLPCIRRADLCIANSCNTGRLAEAIGVSPERIAIVHPGVSLPDPNENGAQVAFRERYGLIDRKLILSVGRLTARKGLPEFVRHVLPAVVKACPHAVLVVIGDDAPDALNKAGAAGAARVFECARELGLGDHIRMLGARDDEELGAAYSASDVCVFPLRDRPGDVEGFGMVAVEAAAHGVPTVAFDLGGVADAISNGSSGWLVAPGDYAGMCGCILRELDRKQGHVDRGEVRRFAETFEWQRFGSRLRDVLRPLLSGGRH